MIAHLRWVLRHEDGAAAVELGLLLPVLMFAAVGFLPLVTRMVDANAIDDAMAEAIRYATKASPVAFDNAGAPECDAQRRRRSGPEVQAFLTAASGGRVVDSTIAVVQPNDAGTVSDPCRAIAGSVVTITATVDTSGGAIGSLSRAARSLPFVSAPDSTPGDLSSTATTTITAVLE